MTRIVVIEERDMIGTAVDMRKREGEAAAWAIQGRVEPAKSLGFFA